MWIDNSGFPCGRVRLGRGPERARGSRPRGHVLHSLRAAQVREYCVIVELQWLTFVSKENCHISSDLKIIILFVSSYHLLLYTRCQFDKRLFLHSVQLLGLKDQRRANCNWYYFFRQTDGKVETTITSMKYQPIGKLQCKLHRFFYFIFYYLKERKIELVHIWF